jgi:tetratricopeptide (TPR) repeat protein
MDYNVNEGKLWGKPRFRNAAYTVISNSFLRQFRKDPATLTVFNKWRLGYNLYKGGKYFDAIKYISEACAEMEEEKLSSYDVEFRAKISQIYLIAARCGFKLFLLTHQHYHLETSYLAYEKSIKNLPIDFLTAIRLPNILFEFCRLLESYGSFESALMTYGKILASFQTYRGYFDVMYRSAIVGKFVSSRVEDATKKQDMVKQCLDIIQFLLEAVPPTMNEVLFMLIFMLYSCCSYPS